jgi:hypothetical protein
MGRKRKLAKIVTAVDGILGDSVKAKKLKKLKALESFIGKMEAKRDDITDSLARDAVDPQSREELERHTKTLHKQIDKAKEILAKMKSDKQLQIEN